MSIKLILQIIIFVYSFLAIVGLFLDKEELNKAKVFLILNFVLIIAYIINY